MIGLRRGIGKVRLDLGRRGRETGEIEGEAAQESFLGSLGRGTQVAPAEFRLQKCIHWGEG